MTDLISRQQAIDTLCKSECGCNNAECRHRDNTDFCVTCDNVKIIKSLPSAQPETNCSEIPNNSDAISRQAVTKFLNDWLSCLFENCHKQSASDLKMIIKDFKNLPSAQPEQRWHPITEKPPRNKDLILKIYDKRNLFYYYHMGFYSAGRYFTYNFCWQYDEDLEVVGWQLCPWESR